MVNPLNLFKSNTNITLSSTQELRQVTVGNITALWTPVKRYYSQEDSQEGKSLLERLWDCNCHELLVISLLNCDLDTLLQLRVLSRAWLDFISPCPLTPNTQNLTLLSSKAIIRLEAHNHEGSIERKMCRFAQEFHTEVHMRVIINHELFFSLPPIKLSIPNNRLQLDVTIEGNFSSEPKLQKINTFFSTHSNKGTYITLTLYHLFLLFSIIDNLPKDKLQLRVLIEEHYGEWIIVTFFSDSAKEKLINIIKEIKFSSGAVQPIFFKAISKKSSWFINLEKLFLWEFNNDLKEQLCLFSLPNLKQVNFVSIKGSNVNDLTIMNLSNPWFEKLEVLSIGAIHKNSRVLCRNGNNKIDPTKHSYIFSNLTKLSFIKVIDWGVKISLTNAGFPELKNLSFPKDDVWCNVTINLSYSSFPVIKQLIFPSMQDSVLNLFKSSFPEATKCVLGDIDTESIANFFHCSLPQLEEFHVGNITCSTMILPEELPKLKVLHLGTIRFTEIVLPKSLPNLQILSIGKKKAILTYSSNGIKTFILPSAQGEDLRLLSLINEAIN